MVKEEKKVEYIELIYDLIFVYMVGRNNTLIHDIQNGFVNPRSFIAYVLCTLAIIQIWNFTTFYINMFGRNGVRDHVFLFINMYLLYFVGQSTRTDWQDYQTMYHVAWGLILVNVAAQYLIELRNHRNDPQVSGLIKRMSLALLVESVFVFLAAIPNPDTVLWLSAAAIISGVALTFYSRRNTTAGSNPVDFMHLSERAMLFVVFTFGEMIIALAVYFIGDGSFRANTIYFSLCAFLIVVGLFLSYEVVYDKMIDREGNHTGLLYMFLHILIIFFMNNITASLEFMREEEINNLPKVIFLIVSIVGYFIFLFFLTRYSKNCNKPRKSAVIAAVILTVSFVVLMLIFREMMYVNIMASVIYVFSMLLLMWKGRKPIHE